VCGVVGVKPGRGRVSDGNAAGDALGLSTIGPLARTVEDAAALLDVLVAPEPGDTDHRRSPRSWLAAAREAPSPLRIGWYVETAAGSLAHPDCVAAVESTAAALAAVGHEVERIANPFPPQFDVLFTQVWWAGAATTMLPPEVEGRLRPITRWFRARGRALTGPEALRALIGVRELGRRAVAATAHLDLVVTPTLATPPAPVGSLRHDDDPERELAALAAFTPFTPPYNASGQPAVSVPVHWTDDGLPIGVQLVGPPAGDGIVLAVARQLEQLVGWPAKRPPAW
jgi:amidase